MQAMRYLMIPFLVLALGACEPKVERRGHVEDEPMAKSIEIGSTSKDQIRRKFGSPSSVSSFGEESWYYMKSRKEAHAFFRPEVKEQHVTQVVFDESGVVKEVKEYGLDDAQKVAFVEKTTPTEGHSLSFMEQVLGNLGRFNKPRKTGATGR